MKYIELENKAREVCPKWLEEEIDVLLETIKNEREVCPESWGDNWNFFEVLDMFENGDLGKERCFKLARTKIERHIGCQVKLGKGESTLFTSRGSRSFKEGDWVFDKAWHQLITN